MTTIRYLTVIILVSLASSALLSCGGDSGGGSGGNDGDGGGGDTGPVVVSSGLVYQLDSAKYDGSTFPSTGCATTVWTELISAATGNLINFAACGVSSGWNGTGTPADPYRLSLDGTDDFVNLGSGVIGPKLNGASAVTIDMWIKYTGLEIGKYDNAAFFVEISANKAGIWFNFRGDGGNAGKVILAGRSRASDAFLEKTSASTIASDTWTHLTGIMDFGAGELNVAINAALETASTVAFGATTYTHGAPVSSDSVTYSNAAKDFLQGEIAYLGVYNVLLDSDEISQNCNALKDRFSGATCN